MLASAMVMLLFKPSSAVRAGPLLRTSSRMLASPRRSARPVAVATEAAVPVFDERLVSEDPELVKSSLLRRKAGDALLASVDRIGELTGERASVISEGNTARMEKKTLSQKIGGHMKAGEQDEAAALKVEVAKLNEVARASNPAPDPAPDPAPNPEPEPEPNPNAEPAPEPEQVADASDAKVDELEAQRSSLFNSLPNLLDPRTPEGVDEDSNVEVSKRGGGGGGALPADDPTQTLILTLIPTLALILTPTLTLATLTHRAPLTDLPPLMPLPPPTQTRTCGPASPPPPPSPPPPQVNKWGCEAELPTGRLWHDDVGTSLGGIDMERTAITLAHNPRSDPDH